MKPYNPPPPDALQTLFLDDTLVICNKPSGLLSVPGLGPEKAVCASSLLEQRHGSIYIVHRLDMDTSGTMVFARTKQMQRQLSNLFRERQVEKTYEALIEGHPDSDNGTIDAAIAKYSLKRPLRHLDPDGREAITHWRVADRAEAHSRVTLTPETGRSHQLRLHMKHLGHPILGDVFYGNPNSHSRLCLHARTLAFEHPASGERKVFDSAADF